MEVLFDINCQNTLTEIVYSHVIVQVAKLYYLINGREKQNFRTFLRNSFPLIIQGKRGRRVVDLILRPVISRQA